MGTSTVEAFHPHDFKKIGLANFLDYILENRVSRRGGSLFFTSVRSKEKELPTARLANRFSFIVNDQKILYVARGRHRAFSRFRVCRISFYHELSLFQLSLYRPYYTLK